MTEVERYQVSAQSGAMDLIDITTLMFIVGHHQLLHSPGGICACRTPPIAIPLCSKLGVGDAASQPSDTWFSRSSLGERYPLLGYKDINKHYSHRKSPPWSVVYGEW